MPRTAVVAGGTGLVGGHLLRLLLEDPAYGKVTALVRRPLSLGHPKLVEEAVDFDRLEPSAPLLKADDVFCCLGTTIGKAGSREEFLKVDFGYTVALAKLAAAQGAGQFLLVSGSMADPRSRFFYPRVKGETDEAVSALPFSAVHILRPSQLLGQRQESRPMEEAVKTLMKLLSPFMLGPFRRSRAIEASAVARAMALLAKRGEKGVHVHESDRIQSLADGAPL